MARFGHPLKAPKPPQQFSNAFAPQNLRCSLRRRPACFAMVPPAAPQAVSIGLRNCHVARFGHPLKASKPPQQLSKAFEPHNRPQQLGKASRMLCHGTSRGAANCFYWASKLPRGMFWAPLKSAKTPAAAFEGLRTSKPAAAAFEGVPPALPWYLPRPHKLFLLGWYPYYVAIQLFRSHGRPHGALCLLWIRPDSCADQTRVRHSGHLCACRFVALLTIPFST